MYEREEYRSAVAAMTEMDRIATEVEVRGARGIGGDRGDARHE